MNGLPLSENIGSRFGKLTVTDVYRKEMTNGRRTFFLVTCDCGTEKEILAQNVKNGSAKSCGCISNELKARANYRHGLHKTRIYQTYTDMKQRCLNPNNSRFHRYGGRGIAICAEWLDSFTNFYEWAMENGYTDKLTIERVDNDGNYCPDNCKWATMAEQLKNRDFKGMRK